jgi:hypothetical protein
MSPGGAVVVEAPRKHSFDHAPFQIQPMTKLWRNQFHAVSLNSHFDQGV